MTDHVPVDLFDAPQTPTPPSRPWLTAGLGMAGLAIAVPVCTIAAVAGFAQGWRSAPSILAGENIIQPFVHLGSALVGAALYALLALAGVCLLAVLAFVIRHRGRGRNRAPSPSLDVTDSEPGTAGMWVCMPDVGAREAEVTSWLLREGDAVVAEQPLFELSTDKVDTEVPSPTSGIVERIAVPVGASVPVGTRLAFISVPGSSVPEHPSPPAEAEKRVL